MAVGGSGTGLNFATPGLPRHRAGLPLFPGQGVFDLSLLGTWDGGHVIRAVTADEGQAAFLHDPPGRLVDRHRVRDDAIDAEIGKSTCG